MADLGPMGMVQDYQQGQAALQGTMLQNQNQQLLIQESQLRLAQQKQAMIDDQRIRAIMQNAALNTPGMQQGQPGQAPTTGLPGQPGQPGQTGMRDPYASADAQLQSQIQLAASLSSQGYTTQAQAILKNAIENTNKLSEQRDRDSQMASRRLADAQKAVVAAQELSVGIKDQNSYDQAKIQWLEGNPGQQMPVWLQYGSYDAAKPAIEQIRNSSKPAIDTLGKIQQTVTEQSTEKKNAAEARLANAKADILARQQSDYREYKTQTEKHGGKPVSFSEWARSNSGGRASALIEQRQDTLATNALEFTRTLGNVTDLPAESSSGIFGNKTTHSLFTAPAEAAANELTSDSVQRYKTEMGALGNHLAWMISGGLNPTSRTQEKYDDLLQIKQGDTQATILTKLARARQEADNALAVKEKSRLISPEMREMFTQLRAELADSIPFTIADVNKWANAKDRKTTFRDFMGKSGVVKPTAGGVEDVLNQYAPVEK